jgi:hypothetical protein
MASGERQRDAGHHHAHHQHLVVHPAHQVNDHQRVEHADPQRYRAVGADVPGHPWCGPDQQCESGKHAQPQQHGPGDDVVAHQQRDEFRHQDERRPVGGGGGGPDLADVVQQRIRILDRSDHVRVETVAQQRALGQIRVGVPAEKRDAQQQRRQPEPGRGDHGVFGCRPPVAEPAAQPQPGHQHRDDAAPQQ